MSVGLSLFATGILALCCGVSSINNEPQKLAQQTSWNNKGMWFEFKNESNAPTAYLYDYVSYRNYYRIDDNGITYLGSMFIGDYDSNGGDVWEVYLNLPNYRGNNITQKTNSFIDTDYVPGQVLKYTTQIMESDSWDYEFILTSFDYLDVMYDNIVSEEFVGNLDFVDAWFTAVDGHANLIYGGLQMESWARNFLVFDYTSQTYNYEFNWFDVNQQSNSWNTYTSYCNYVPFTWNYDDDYDPTFLYDKFDYLGDQNKYYSIQSRYNFSADEEIPFNEDYLNGDIDDIYYRYKLSFQLSKDVYYRFMFGNFSRMNDGGVYIVRLPAITDDYSTGYNNGYQTGYSDGQRIGYENGYRNGVNDTYATDNSFFHLFGAIADTPILMLRSLFDFDLFGVNVLVAVLSLLTAIITAWVIRKFI